MGESPAHNSPVKTKVRAFNELFTSSNPEAHPEGFLAAVNPNSEEIYPNALVENGFDEIRSRAPWPEEAGERSTDSVVSPPETVRFQGMRVAYFCMDRESSEGNLVLNRIISLKEAAGKS